MAPLFCAVYHGCQAGKHAETRNDVYRDRILRGDEFFLVNKLGAFGVDLTLIANFFVAPWNEPTPSLSAAGQAWVIAIAAFALRALGRLREAVDISGRQVRRPQIRRLAKHGKRLEPLERATPHAWRCC